MALAAESVERETGSHGFSMSEALDPANEYAFEGSDKPLTDFAERELKHAQERYYKRWPDADRAGHIWQVKRKQLPAAEEEADGSGG